VTCFNFVAAHRVSSILKDLRISSLAQLYREFSPYDLAIPKLGALSLMVIGAAFELRELGTIETWAAKHRKADQVHEFVTFSTLKGAHAVASKSRKRSR
jgi:hypothetical protein